MVSVRAEAFERLPFELTLLSNTDGRSGEVLWAAPAQDADLMGSERRGPRGRIGLAFPWAVVAPGVLVVRDVLAIATNALLMDEQGGWVPRQDAAYLTSVVYRLEWQLEVLRRIQP